MDTADAEATTKDGDPGPNAEFVEWEHPSPALDAIGSLRAHRADPLRAGFEVTEPKLNGRGLLHAGVIATIADVTIGHALAAITEGSRRFVTVQLSCDLLGTASLGDWIDVEIVPTKTGGRLAAGNARFRRGDRTITTAHALFLDAGTG